MPKELTYKVYYVQPENPLDLQGFLYEQLDEGYELICAVGSYLVFKQQPQWLKEILKGRLEG